MGRRAAIRRRLTWAACVPASPTWPAAWRARAWAAYARGDSLTAHVLWACATDLEEAVMPRIIPRAEWGWDGWAGTPATVPTSKRTEFFVHYEGPPTGGKTGPSVPRAIHAYHKSVGWSGIGYTWVVTQDGAIYEGRGWDLSGAHCPGHNTSGWSVQIHIGGDETPSPEALTSARWLYDQAVARAGRRLTMLGHVEGGASTSCPGQRLLAWVHAGMPAGAPTDSTPPTIPTLTEDEMPITYDEMTQIAQRVLDGVQVGSKNSTLGSYVDASARDAAAALAEVRALRADLAKAPAVGGSINLDALAKSVADELAKRMQS